MSVRQQRENSLDPDSVKAKFVQVDGESYDVTGPPKFIAEMVGHLRLVAFAILIAGDMIFGAIGGISTMPRVVQDTYGWIKENKFQFGMGVFFLSSMIQANLLQSGAFEIYVNGNLEYSKLDTKTMPDLDSLKRILAKYDVHVQI